MTTPPSIAHNHLELQANLQRLTHTKSRRLRISLSRDATAYVVAARIVQNDLLRLHQDDSTLAHLVKVWVRTAADFSTTAGEVSSDEWDDDWDERLAQLGKSLVHTETLLCAHLAAVADAVRFKVCIYRFERERRAALSVLLNPSSENRRVSQFT